MFQNKHGHTHTFYHSYGCVCTVGNAKQAERVTMFRIILSFSERWCKNKTKKKHCKFSRCIRSRRCNITSALKLLSAWRPYAIGKIPNGIREKAYAVSSSHSLFHFRCEENQHFLLIVYLHSFGLPFWYRENLKRGCEQELLFAIHTLSSCIFAFPCTANIKYTVQRLLFNGVVWCEKN